VVLSEFIVNPTTMETDIGRQPEMARVLKKGGKILITDFITTHSDESILEELKKIDVLYICKATIDDFEKWMKEAGLINIKIKDLSKLFAKIWRKSKPKIAIPSTKMLIFCSSTIKQPL
jgi:hypothetical protein